MKREKKLKRIGLILAGLIILVAWIYHDSNERVRIRHFEVQISELPAAFDGFRLLVMSDLHAELGEKKRINLFDISEEAPYDLLVFLGDIVEKEVEALEPYKEEMTALAGKSPVLFVDGNHDRWWRYAPIKDFLIQQGWTVLDNETFLVQRSGASLYLVGTSDYYFTDQRPTLLTLQRMRDQTTILLSHQPQLFDALEILDVELMLSGHTHGGQFRLPFLPVLYAPGQGFFPTYGEGFYRQGSSTLFVTKGLGATGPFKFRWFNPPEAVVLTLRTKP